MKKIFAILTVLALLTGGLFAAATQVDSGTLTVFGKIGSGDVSFEVKQEQTLAQAVDLLNDPLIATNGAGYKVGYWHFIADNQLSPVDYLVTYTYNPLSTNNDGVTEAIGIELIEVVDENTADVKASAATTTLSATAGNNEIKRDILFRLNAAGAAVVGQRPANNGYKTTVTITLTTE